MALRFIDGFDHYATADLPEKWTSVFGATAIHATNGRRGTGALRIDQYSEWATLTLDNQATWILGFAIRIAALPTSGSAMIIDWRENASVQCRLDLLASGALVVMRGGTTQIATSPPALMTLNVFHYLELLLTFHGTTGVAALRVNGIEQFNVTGLNTITSANAYANILRLGNQSSGVGGTIGTSYIDDLYLCDGTGSANNTFLGDCRVDTLLPNGDGSNSAWTVSTGTTHSTLVDETTPNDDTDYLSTSTAGARDTHTLGNLGAMTSPTVRGVQHSFSARKDDAGTREVKSCLKSGATTQVGTVTHSLTSAYAYYKTIWETDPNTSAAWTTSAIDALEAGMENQ